MATSRSPLGKDGGYLDGKMLIAMPTMTDPRFERTVIYLCAHSAEGAMGIVVNKTADAISFPELLEQLDIATADSPDRIDLSGVPVHFGGPVETARGFVLHTADYFVDSCTLPIDTSVSLTATIDILRAIAGGAGPDRSLLALGYAGWAPGQLETEIQSNGWLHCDADSDLIFDHGNDTKYKRALAKIGIDPSMLATGHGHA